MSDGSENKEEEPSTRTAGAADEAPSVAQEHLDRALGVKDSQEGNPNDNDDTDWTHASDLRRPDRTIWIVTTAALPWRTGTAVNPLLRALELARHRPQHAVTLLIPWLADPEARQQLYGANCHFEKESQQEAWIRDYCRTRCGCTPQHVQALRILFWPGVYNESFGSIFPTTDISRLIPDDQADVAILEEPEHLNWFRMIDNDTDSKETNSEKDGWNKFAHVLGILHTNYASYVRQYGMGASLVTAPVLDALSALVVRAYCTRVVRLSATLPSLDARKEVTANVHGVRDEFLEKAEKNAASIDSDEKEEKDTSDQAPVYFIGKLIWAKGFEHVLELQELFKQATGNYFEMDVYGGGNDEASIKRAFYGRHKHSTLSDDDLEDSNNNNNNNNKDKQAAKVFEAQDSLRLQLETKQQNPASPAVLADTDEEEAEEDDDDDEEEEEEEEETQTADTNNHMRPLDILGALSRTTLSTGVETADAALQALESVVQAGIGMVQSKSDPSGADDEEENEEDDEVDDDKEEGSKPKAARKSKLSVPKVPFIKAPRSRFKWRRHPLPARFLGVLDHIELKEMPASKIFLNMSTSEVLCTTSAEALAMGKFVILPKHASNDFFLKFSNCLPYTNLKEAVHQLMFALENEPKSLTDEEVHILSWQGATERLYEAAALTKAQQAQREADGIPASELKAARFHLQASRKSQFVTRRLLHGSSSKSSHSS